MTWAEASLLPRQAEACVAAPAVTVAPHVVEYPLYISTYVSANTVINIDGNGNNITINNAPTTLNLLTTGTALSSATIGGGGPSGAQTSSGSSATSGVGSLATSGVGSLAPLGAGSTNSDLNTIPASGAAA